MLAFLAARARAFRRDNRANVAMMFGLSLVPLLVATGAGIDFARGMMVHQRMAEALDAAALAVGNATAKPSTCPGTDTASITACTNLQQTAQQYFDSNYDRSQDTSYGAPSAVSITIVNQSVTLSSTVPLKLTLLGLAPLGVGPAPNVNASSTVVWGQTKLWVALVLDNSGSMSDSDSSGTTKIAALKDALTDTTKGYGLLKTLQNAAASDNDVNVAIVPFTRSVDMGKTAFGGSSFIDWGEWEAPPANVTVAGSVGPGSACPFTTTSTDRHGNVSINQNSAYGYYCMPSSTNQSDNNAVATIPSSGLICPGIDSGSANPDHNARYYNGCWDSTFSRTQIVTTAVATPSTLSQSCSQKGTAAVSCTAGSSSNGNATTTSNTTTVSGYTADSTTSSSQTSPPGTPSDGTKSCDNKTPKTCTWTRKTITTTTVTTVVKTGTTPYNHAWTHNDHSTWSGCVMDRQQYNKQTTVYAGSGVAGVRTPSPHDYDESNTQPANSTTSWDDSQFPAENAASCPAATVVTLNHDWTSLPGKITAMTPNGSTNQAIGVAHGFQMLTTGDPYSTGSLPPDTTKVLILFSDGLNTQNRWVGNGSTEGTPDDLTIDTRMKATCTAAKNDGITIYAIFIHIGSNGSSDALSKCATDSSKFYDLTASSQIKTAFSDIAQKITNLRVSK